MPFLSVHDVDVFIFGTLNACMEGYADEHATREEIESIAKEVIPAWIDGLLEFLNGEFKEFIVRYAKQYGIRPFAMVCAHGGDDGSRWILEDGISKEFRAEQVIRRLKVDGKYACILMWCCNPGGYTLVCKHAFVLQPDTEFAPSHFMEGGSLYTSGFSELIVPKNLRGTIGEAAIDEYTIGYHLRQLKQKA